MQRKHRIWTSLLAAFGLLALVFSLWAQNPVLGAAFEGDPSNKHKQHAFCISTANSFYLAEVKPRTSGLVSGGTSAVAQLMALNKQQSLVGSRIREEATTAPAPPLWLMNRALLI